MSKKLTIDEIKKRINNKYIIPEQKYINSHTKIEVICSEHGEFLISPKNLLSGRGCSKCAGINKLNINNFIKKSKEIHGDKYDYSLVNYKNMKTKVKIICKKHGMFEQIPDNHIRKKYGCPICNKKEKLSIKLIQEKVDIIHKGKNYIIPKQDYINNQTKIKIKCHKHGYFYQTPGNLLYNKNGCPKCNYSKGEHTIECILKEKNINFESQKKFNDCKNINPLPFDFYLPEYNTCIEYDGEQHYIPIERFGGIERLKKIQYNDKIKNEYCIYNNIKLFRIKYNDNIRKKMDIII